LLETGPPPLLEATKEINGREIAVFLAGPLSWRMERMRSAKVPFIDPNVRKGTSLLRGSVDKPDHARTLTEANRRVNGLTVNKLPRVARLCGERRAMSNGRSEKAGREDS